MDRVLKGIDDAFLGKQMHFEAFASSDTRLEGWIKAELIVLFRQMKGQEIIVDAQREVNIPGISGRSQIDFRIVGYPS